MSTTLATFTDLRGPGPERVLAANFLASYGEPTRSHHAHNLTDFFRWLERNGLSITEVKRPHIELYQRELSEVRHLMNSTVANKLASLSGLFRYAVVDGFLPANPLLYVKRPSVPRLSNTQSLTRSEMLAVLDVGKKSCPRDEALLCVMALNGLRVGEVAAIDIEDLSRKGGYHVLRVRREKGGETPEVPFVSRTSWAIEQTIYGRTSGPVFLNRQGERMDRASIARVVSRCCKKAGIKKRITPHSLRHTFITLALDAGASVRDVQNSVGHRDMRQVAYYDRNKSSLPRNATHLVAAFVEGS